MTQEVHTVGCDSCNYYVEFDRYEPAKTFLEQERQDYPFGCNCGGIAVVRVNKDLEFRD